MGVLSGKTAIVTGASAPQGIGRAIALRLAMDGADIVAADVDGTVEVQGEPRSRANLLADLVAEINQGQSRAIAVRLDVTREEDVKACIIQTNSAFARIDILVNNAGSLAGSDNFLSTTPNQWEYSFRVNMLGPMMMARR